MSGLEVDICVLVEDEKTLEHLLSMFVGDCTPDLVMKLLICERSLDSHALE